MELTDLFNGKTVFFDTAPIIYFIEKNNRYHHVVKPIISMLDSDEISHEISEYAALLRAQHGLKTPDAIQLSTAIINKSDFFLTNDPALKKVTRVTVIILDDHLGSGEGKSGSYVNQ